MLKDARVQSTVHSIQLITATGDALSEPESFLLSREPLKLEECIKRYTGFDEQTSEFTRSLAAIDIEDGPYLVNDLLSPERNNNGPLPRHSVKILRNWKYKGSGAADDQETLVSEWLSYLDASFPGLGSTLWVTQRCSSGEQAPKSSAFVLFAGRLDSSRDPHLLFRISKLLRDELVTEIVYAYKAVIGAQQRLQETLLMKVLSESSSGMPLAPEVLEQMQAYSLALTSNLPILISGEAGTGKLAVAREVHRRREAYFRANAEATQTTHTENPITLVRAPTLVGTEDEIKGKLRQALRSDNDVSGAIPKNPLIIIDDVQGAGAVAQEVLCRVLDDFALGGSLTTELACAKAKFLFTSLPGLDALVACGAFNASLYSQLSAFEIFCLPLRERFLHPDDGRAVLNYAIKAISGALETTRNGLITTQEEEHIRNQQWPGNFRDLNNYLVRLFLERGRQSTHAEDHHA